MSKYPGRFLPRFSIARGDGTTAFKWSVRCGLGHYASELVYVCLVVWRTPRTSGRYYYVVVKAFGWSTVLPRRPSNVPS